MNHDHSSEIPLTAHQTVYRNGMPSCIFMERNPRISIRPPNPDLHTNKQAIVFPQKFFKFTEFASFLDA